MLEVGDTAPDFTAPTADGTPLTLSMLRGRPVTLFFYPKANSPGCTAETRGFVRLYQELSSRGHAVVGVSVDSVAAQQSFRDRCSVPFPLVSDADRTIARRYGVLGLLGVAKRVTFFLDAQGRVVDVLQGVLPGPHVRRAAERAGTVGT